MRRFLLTLACVVWATLAAEAAPPTITEHSYTLATVSQTDVSVTMSAGQAIVVAYIKYSASNRTVTVTDDSGSNSYSEIANTGSCSTTRCLQVFADYSVSGGTYTVTVLQSGSFVSYRVWIFLYTCGTTCEADAVSVLLDTSLSATHYGSADSTVIDTGTDATVAMACVVESGATTFGTETVGSGYEAFTLDGSSQVFGQYEDDIATAFTDERGTWTSGNAVPTTCAIWAIRDGGGGGGGGSGSGSGRLMLLGVG